MEENKVTIETLAKDVIDQAKHQAKMWFIAFIATFAALIGTNLYWIYEFTSYEYVSQDGSGFNSINTGHQEELNIGSENED